MPSAGFHIRSAAFAEGARIPRLHTCEGGDRSPPLTWDGAPAGAKSFALVCDDPDAPAGTWHHWGVYDIPATTKELPAGVAAGAPGLKQALNDFGRVGYGGPCPPKGHGVHHYRFTVYALDRIGLALDAKSRVPDVARVLRGHVLAQATLTGLYSR